MAYMERRTMLGANHLVVERHIEERRERHLRAVSAVRSRVDTRPPADFSHITRGGKKASLAEDRYVAIERDNMKLLRKMHEILHQTNPAFESSGPVGPRSLNIVARRADLTRIMEENLVSPVLRCRNRTPC